MGIFWEKIMLADLTPLEEIVYLINDSGIQFMDFGVALDLENEPSGRFSYMANRMPARLLYNRETQEYFHLEQSEQQECNLRIVDEDDIFPLSMKKSLEFFDGVWLPMPYFRFMPPGRFDPGPTNWARMRLIQLQEPDLDGNTHRLTLAFDTRALDGAKGTTYLAPTSKDVLAGSMFCVACYTYQLRWFLDLKWVREWLCEVFKDVNAGRIIEYVEEDLEKQHHVCHYLNLLSLLAKPVPEERSERTKARISVPHIILSPNRADTRIQPIEVDMVLDIGNSRTCGVLIENHRESGDGLKHNYVLQLRDLHAPECVYRYPFVSRIEFAQSTFGKENWSVLSGRHDAFQWPTIARIGTEAARLSAQRSGTEGSTGLSSPKRYLWDENPYTHGWRFNSADTKVNHEAIATAKPFSDSINDEGKALSFIKDENNRFPVFSPHYTRSSLMTFMLAEVLTQALSQINSAAQRTRMGHTSTPRFISSITLTVPPGMPLVERSILNDRLLHAIALVWECMGWHDGKENPFKAKKNIQGQADSAPPLPKVKVEWDEASCGQLVYLYTEIHQNFAGHPEEFFDTLARPDKDRRKEITLASIDVGGGTADLVITDYCLDSGGAEGGRMAGGSNVAIVPRQRFRDSFKIAGDDILLDVIQRYVLPSFEAALRDAGVMYAPALMSRICGNESVSAQDAILRQQLNLQVFVPIGLKILHDYERFDPAQPVVAREVCYGDLLGSSKVSERVREYVATAVRHGGGNEAKIDVDNIPLCIDLKAIHDDFIGGRFNITKVLDALSEIIVQYPCDILLLTGRSSMLPGLQSYLRRKMSIPPGRIVSMHGYHVGGWYPFHLGRRIDDPKTTAAVGAMLCLLSEKRRLTNFYFSVAKLKPYSTMRYIGRLDENNLIVDRDVLYSDAIKQDGNREYLQLDEPGEQPRALQVLGRTRLGYRQLAAQRWVASPLYLLTLTKSGEEKLARARIKGSEEGEPHLLVRFKIEEPDRDQSDEGIISERLIIDENIRSNTEEEFGMRDLRLQLYTMASAESGASNYWLDSGSVNPK